MLSWKFCKILRTAILQNTLVSILDSCIFSQFVSTYYSKSLNFSQVAYFKFSHEVLLNIGICYIYLVTFTLSNLRLNTICRLIRLAIRIDLHAERNSQTGRVSTRKLFGLWFTDSQIPGSHFRITPIYTIKWIYFNG